MPIFRPKTGVKQVFAEITMPHLLREMGHSDFGNFIFTQLSLNLTNLTNLTNYQNSLDNSSSVIYTLSA